MRKAFAAVLAPRLAGLGNAALTAENDPTHALTMIEPFPVGGATDIVARYLGERIRPILGQNVIIENSGARSVRSKRTRAPRAAADVYTLSMEPRPRTC